MADQPASQNRPPLDDAQRRDLIEKAGYGSATTPHGDLTSPNRQTPPQVGPDSPFRQKEFEGVVATGTGDSPSWAVADLDEGNGPRESRLPVVQLDRDGHPALIVAGCDGVSGSVGAVEPQRNRASAAQEVSPPVLGVGKLDTDDNLVTDRR